MRSSLFKVPLAVPRMMCIACVLRCPQRLLCGAVFLSSAHDVALGSAFPWSYIVSLVHSSDPPSDPPAAAAFLLALPVHRLLLLLFSRPLQIRNVLEFKPKDPNRGWQVSLQQSALCTCSLRMPRLTLRTLCWNHQHFLFTRGTSKQPPPRSSHA